MVLVSGMVSVLVQAKALMPAERLLVLASMMVETLASALA